VRTPTLEDVRASHTRIAASVVRTPLLRLQVEIDAEIWLKLENLQPIGSVKLRGALSRMLAADARELRAGVYTASAGNMAQGIAWGARELGVECTVLVPDNAPQTKVEAITRLGARIVKLPYEEWWQVLVDHGAAGMKGEFIHPVSNQQVLAGNATIGAEICEELPGVAAVFVPYGGGGLSVGIAAAMADCAPAARVYACEVDTAAPYHASVAANRPMTIDHRPSFVDGIGGRSVLAEMWPMTSTLLADSLVVTVAQVAAAVRLLVTRARVVAEGAGATAVAAALDRELGWAPDGSRCVAVISGGNIDRTVLADILREKI
jgi:threonine dehydratase